MDTNAEISRAKDAARRKKNAEARAILRDVLAAEPDNFDAWIAFASVAQKPEHAEQCLRRAAKLDPHNEQVRRMLADLQPALAAPVPQEDAPLVSSTGTSEAEQKPAARGRTLEVALLVTLILVGCCVVALLTVAFLPRLPVVAGLLSGKPVADASAITAPIIANINASNAEDIRAYMATIHSQSPLYDQTESLLSPMFANYDLSFEVRNLEVIEQSASEAKVSFVLVTRKINGPAFNDNKVNGVMVMRPENGVWKIYNQQVDSVEYLK
jgi:hypothetical protein